MMNRKMNLFIKHDHLISNKLNKMKKYQNISLKKLNIQTN